MHEINVLTNLTTRALCFKYISNSIALGEYSDLNRESTVPHTVALPIELHSPIFFLIAFYFKVIINGYN